MDNEQFSKAAEKYIDMVYRVAVSCLGSSGDADDVTQEVFIRLLKSKKGFESESHLKNWLIRVTVNECKRILASVWRKTEPIDGHQKEMSFSQEEDLDVYRICMSLPWKYRIVIHLYYFEGYSTAEIASLIGSVRSTVCTRLERARKLLREKLLEAQK